MCHVCVCVSGRGGKRGALALVLLFYPSLMCVCIVLLLFGAVLCGGKMVEKKVR